MVSSGEVILLFTGRRPASVEGMMSGRAVGTPVELERQPAVALAVKLLVAAGLSVDAIRELEAAVERELS